MEFNKHSNNADLIRLLTNTHVASKLVLVSTSTFHSYATYKFAF